jgi:hypothetical protein
VDVIGNGRIMYIPIPHMTILHMWMLLEMASLFKRRRKKKRLLNGNGFSPHLYVCKRAYGFFRGKVSPDNTLQPHMPQHMYIHACTCITIARIACL